MLTMIVSHHIASHSLVSYSCTALVERFRRREEKRRDEKKRRRGEKKRDEMRRREGKKRRDEKKRREEEERRKDDLPLRMKRENEH